MRNWRINVLRFVRDFFLTLARQMLQRAHIVQAVGQLDHDHADIIHHGQHHLADVFRLPLLGAGKIDFADLGNAFDDVRHLLAELALDVFNSDGGVFDRIVQQAGNDGRRIHLHFG